MSVDKLRKITKPLIHSEILELGSFLLYIKENISNEKLLQDDIRNLSIAYHRLWWFRTKLIERYPTLKDFPKLEAIPNKKHLKAAQLDLEILLSRNPKFADSISIPKVFETDIANATKFLCNLIESTGSVGAQHLVNLETNGELWYVNKQNTYQMNAKNRRYKLLRYLREHDDCCATSLITKDLGYTSVKRAGDDVSKLNAKIEGKIGLKDIIENIPGEGYRINRNYNLVLIK